MKYHPEYIKELMKKHVCGEATDDEVAVLLAALGLYSPDEVLQMAASIDIDLLRTGAVQEAAEIPLFSELQNRIEKYEKEKKQHKRKEIAETFVYLLILLFAGIWIWFINRPVQVHLSCGLISDENIPTANYTCNLMLADGKIVVIDSANSGMIRKTRGVEIYKTPEGVIEFRKVEPVPGEIDPDGFYTISTPKGQQYRIVLPDGTSLRLNAASAVRFPVSYSSGHRYLQMQGEVYFEVTKEKDPLIIETKDAVITVRGAVLNINTYFKGTTTTAIKGSIDITSGPRKVTVPSGQQALTAAYGYYLRDSSIQVKKADRLQVASWARPQREYVAISMQDFVRDMARWYDFQVYNINCVSKKLVYVSICYNTPEREVLKIFRQMGLRFNYSDKKIRFCEPVITPAKA
jgi:transmembrane sensor